MLRWVFERCAGTGKAVETPIGRMPAPTDIDTRGLNIPPTNLAKLLNVDVDGWLAEVPLIREHFAKFGDRLPQGMKDEVNKLEQRLLKAKG